ncbi:MAG: branched chain amino acid aminotransferase, partial [Candidatus Zixiibacteriota bacterium]
MVKSEYIWMNGKFVKWDDATIHICSHVIHYGSSVFEGMRIYKTPKGPIAFRLGEHSRRLLNSAKIYHMDIPYTTEELDEAVLQTVAINKLDECYVRPVAYRGYESLGVDPTPCPVDVAIAVWPWG